VTSWAAPLIVITNLLHRQSPCNAPLEGGRVGGRRLGRTAVRLAWFPPAAASNRACGSLAHGSLTFFTGGHSASRSPRPVGSWRDDGCVEGDQPEAVRRLVGHGLPPVSPTALVALGHEPREAVERVEVDVVELSGGVFVAEVARLTAQEAVDVPHDVVNGDQQPASVGDLTGPVACVLHRRP
jgi:hypothetical protein